MFYSYGSLYILILLSVVRSYTVLYTHMYPVAWHYKGSVLIGVWLLGIINAAC